MALVCVGPLNFPIINELVLFLVSGAVFVLLWFSDGLDFFSRFVPLFFFGWFVYSGNPNTIKFRGFQEVNYF